METRGGIGSGRPGHGPFHTSGTYVPDGNAAVRTTRTMCRGGTRACAGDEALGLPWILDTYGRAHASRSIAMDPPPGPSMLQLPFAWDRQPLAPIASDPPMPSKLTSLMHPSTVLSALHAPLSPPPFHDVDVLRIQDPSDGAGLELPPS